MIPDVWPDSIRGINRLPEDQRLAVYTTLLPDEIFIEFGIDPLTHEYNGHPVIQVVAHAGSRAVEIIVRREALDRDPLLYLNMADTFNNQLLVLLVVVNDPDAPRFNIDVDAQGNSTHFGTSGRNIPAELAAMQAGLAPGQIRRGRRAFKRSVPIFEDFVRRMGHDLFFIEPLAYHNAIIFERYGFAYLRGQKEMATIHREFQPGGEFHRRLAAGNPFRQPDAWQSVRGRAWAIHDGILGHPFTGFQMYKRIGKNAGVNTFPDALW
ncbi:MAG: hypothetical protein MUE40_08790 [Anaerolineae bacterium]|nr:hypothetical protein [Anaerolineae bacterium]